MQNNAQVYLHLLTQQQNVYSPQVLSLKMKMLETMSEEFSRITENQISAWRIFYKDESNKIESFNHCAKYIYPSALECFVDKRVSDNLRDNAVRMSRDVLTELPFQTICKYADILFDSPSPSQITEEEIFFLKSTRLRDIEYQYGDNPDVFTIRSIRTKNKIQLSNRIPSNGEFRGQVLRDYLNGLKEISPDESLYDAISNAIKHPVTSDLVEYARRTLCGSYAEQFYHTKMSEDHFNLFIKVLWNKIQKNIKKVKCDENALSGDKDKLWERIDINLIYEITQKLFLKEEVSASIKEMNDENLFAFIDFNLQLLSLQDMAFKLLTKGHHTAASEAFNIYCQFNENTRKLIEGELSIKDFRRNCVELIQDAPTGELKNHRSFFGFIWYIIEVLLNILTLGTVTIHPTNSIQKINDLKIFLIP